MWKFAYHSAVAAIFATFFVSHLVAEDVSPKRLDAAKTAYAKFGAVHDAQISPTTKEAFHVFIFPAGTTDAELKDLPNLPFEFGLDFSKCKIGDEGLKDIKNLKNLTFLFLRGTNVTDAGAKGIEEALPKCVVVK